MKSTSWKRSGTSGNGSFHLLYIDSVINLVASGNGGFHLNTQSVINLVASCNGGFHLNTQSVINLVALGGIQIGRAIISGFRKVRIAGKKIVIRRGGRG